MERAGPGRVQDFSNRFLSFLSAPAVTCQEKILRGSAKPRRGLCLVECSAGDRPLDGQETARDKISVPSGQAVLFKGFFPETLALRPLMIVHRGRLYSAMGDTLKCVDAKSEKILWKKILSPPKEKDAKKPLLNSVLTPPALVNDKVFLGTTFGDVYCLGAESGDLIWKAKIGEPIVFQPAVAKGRVYLSTNLGHLYCIETGDKNDDGWLMWGANASHNGLAK